MKRFLFATSIITLLFTACSKNSGSSPTPTPQSKVVVSFEKQATVMATSKDLVIKLLDENGNPTTAKKDITIPIEVNTDKSTAQLDVDFGFIKTPAEVMIPAGKSEGSISVRMLTDTPSKERNSFTLQYNISNLGVNFTKGTEMCKVAMIGNIGNDLVGTWKMKALINNLNKMTQAWSDLVTFPQSADNGYPEQNTEDMMTFNDDGTLTTSFKSTFKNFFGAKCNYTFEKPYRIRLGRNNGIDVILLDVDNVNRSFDKNHQSELKDSYVGLRLDDKGQLHVYLLDYKPTSFGTEWATAEMYNPERPITTSSDMYIEFVMVKETK